ncbi:MAG: hypothetical protein L6R42_002807 [Xanthoria sp. 1 TBL-2021]|nr:MAG: hypothetical protein L6R42_002807 [Xanthoria sp. 1 TBL-2021]
MSDTEQSPSSSTSEPIALQVGEQRFLTSRDTLSRSDHLNAVISGRWDSNTQPDGSFFIDADPEIFKHILRFLRHGVYPLCYDKAKGHDFAMYAAIQKQADYFVIPKLVKWLSQGEYTKAITIATMAQIVEGVDKLDGTTDSGTKISYYPTWRTVSKYVCPRGIAVHYGNTWRCGRDCRKAQGDAEDEYEDCPVLSTLALTEKTVFDKDSCLED